MKRSFKWVMVGIIGLILQSCASYKYAQKVKMIAFDDNLKNGKAVGSIKGKDCTWSVLSYNLGGPPTVDKAFSNAIEHADEIKSAGFEILSQNKNQKPKIRYVNNASTENSGFNAGLFGKSCIEVMGSGYL